MAKMAVSLKPFSPNIKTVSLVLANKLKNWPAKTNRAKLIILPFNLLVTLLILKFLSENSLVCIRVYKRIKTGIK